MLGINVKRCYIRDIFIEALVVVILLFTLGLTNSSAGRVNQYTTNSSIQSKITSNQGTFLFKSKTKACESTIKVSVISLNKVRQMIVRSSSAAYNFFCKRSTPFSKVLPIMIVKKVKPSEFKDLTQFNEKDDAILPNGMPMGLRMWTEVSILNTTKQQQLK